MKKLIIMAVIATAISFPAFGRGPSLRQIPHPKELVKTDGVGEAIARRYIEAQGWCSRPRPRLQPGQIVIYYVRDRAGACVTRFVKG